MMPRGKVYTAKQSRTIAKRRAQARSAAHTILKDEHLAEFQMIYKQECERRGVSAKQLTELRDEHGL